MAKERFVELGELDSNFKQLVEIVHIFSQTFVICPVTEDIILSLNPHILNSVVVLVAEQETGQLIRELWGENLYGYGGTFWLAG